MAQQIQTHYDNLKVMRDAPVQEIKAAYRRLAQEYHPDRNAEADALRIMKTINLAWDVLSDPERRAKHDRWIADQEQRAMQGRAGGRTPQQTASPSPRAQAAPAAPVPAPFSKNAVMGVAAALLLLSAAMGVYMFQRPAEEAELDVVSGAVDAPNFPAIAANNAKAYATEEETQFGPAYFDFNNTANAHEVEIHLFRDGKPSRRIFIPAGQRYSLNDLAFGHFTITYQTRVGGELRTFRANDTFALMPTTEELELKRYDIYSKNRLTMFNFADGKATEIPADKF